MTNTEQMKMFLDKLVEKNGYAFSSGYIYSMYIEVFNNLSKKKQKELLNCYINGKWS